MPPPLFSDPGEPARKAAQATLDSARQQLTGMGDDVASAIRDAAAAAPQDSSWLDDAGDFLADAGGHLVNGLASFGNAMLNHPGEVAAAAAGDDHVSPMQTNQSTSGAGTDGEPPFSPPKEITGKTDHGARQMADREGHGVNDAAAHDVVANPTKPPRSGMDNHGGRCRYVGKDAVVNLNRQGEIATARARGRAGWRHE